MNRLSLAQRLQTECGVSGALTTTISQTGESSRLVNWVDQAWAEIQTEHDDWRWMRSSNMLGAGMSFATVAGQPSYPLGTGAGTCGVLATSFGKWVRDAFRNYTTTVGVSNEMFLDQIPYDVWRDAYMFGAMRSVQTRPVAVAIGPDESICLGPPPNALYTITGDYYVAPSVMAADLDVPTLLPVQYHMIIVYKAMMMYAGYEAASEVFQRGEQGYQLLLKQLEVIKMPTMTFAGSLA